MLLSSYFQPAWDWGGPVRSMWNLSRGLSSLGVDVTVISTNAKQTGIIHVPKERIEEGVNIVTNPIFAHGYCMSANRLGLSVPFWKEIVTHSRSADIIHINGFWGTGPIIGVLACATYKRPYIISTRGNLQEDALNDKKLKKQLAFALGVKRAISAANALHYTTQLEKAWSPKWTKSINSIVIPNPVEIRIRINGEKFRAKHGIDKNTILLGSIGRIHRRKGLNIVAKALGKISRNDIAWIIVGADEGYSKELLRIIREQGIGNRTMFVGELKGEQLDQAFAGIDILVLPALGENFGNVIVEAAMQGTPSIVSNQLGLMDWIIENNTGLVIPLDVDKWANVLYGMEKNEIARLWEPDRLVRLAILSFSIENVSKQMLDQYEIILSKNRKAKRCQ